MKTFTDREIEKEREAASGHGHHAEDRADDREPVAEREPGTAEPRAIHEA